MVERFDRLTARHDPAGPRSGTDGFTRPRQDPSPGDAQRFAQALRAGHLENENPAVADRGAPDGSGPVPGPAAPSGPFDLLRKASAHTLESSSGPRLQPFEQLQGLVKRLAIERPDDPSSRRSVRVELDEDSWPGVAVRVFEDAGAWVAEFHCRDESSFIRLATPATDMAHELARALQHDAVWCVVAQDLPAGGAWQSWANQEHQGHPAVCACSSAR